MQKHLTGKNRLWAGVLLCLLVVTGLAAAQSAVEAAHGTGDTAHSAAGSASQTTHTHVMKGIVKSVDMASKTLVVTRHDGAEETFKLTSSAVMQAGSVTGGSRVFIRYTENDGVKTALEVKGLPPTPPQR